MNRNRILKRVADTLPYNTGHPLPMGISSSSSQPINNFDNQQSSMLNQPADPKIVNEVTRLFERIKGSANGLKDMYYALFDNLNALFATYPSLYKQLQMTVKLPTNNDAMNIVALNNDLMQALERFKDPVYLNSYISNSSETLM